MRKSTHKMLNRELSDLLLKVLEWNEFYREKCVEKLIVFILYDRKNIQNQTSTFFILQRFSSTFHKIQALFKALKEEFRFQALSSTFSAFQGSARTLCKIRINWNFGNNLFLLISSDLCHKKMLYSFNRNPTIHTLTGYKHCIDFTNRTTCAHTPPIHGGGVNKRIKYFCLLLHPYTHIHYSTLPLTCSPPMGHDNMHNNALPTTSTTLALTSVTKIPYQHTKRNKNLYVDILL